MNKAIEQGRVLLVNGRADDAFKLVIKHFKKAKDAKASEGQADDAEEDKEFQAAYYILGECAIEIDNLEKAQDLLVAAYWTTVKKGDKSADKSPEDATLEDLKIKALRHKAFAKLFTKQVDSMLKRVHMAKQ